MQADPRDLELERQLDTWGASQSHQELSLEIRSKLQGILTSSLTPVKPLPSQRKLLFELLAVLTAGAVGLIAIMDKTGFHLMTKAQLASMAAILAGGGILFSLIIAWQMVPGSRRGFPLSLALALSGFGVFGGIMLLFPWRTSGAFVPEGWPCTAMELIIAVPAAVVFWLLARRGALFASAGLGVALTGSGAFLALAPLQTQCMFQQTQHLLVWHAGTAVILIGLGALIGDCSRRFGRG